MIKSVCPPWLSVLLMLAPWALIAAEPNVVWAADLKETEGWAATIMQLRDAREVKPLRGYLHSEAVVWADFHDAGRLALKDGRTLTVSLSGWKWEEIMAWKDGKKLFLCYDEQRGASLLEPESGRFLLVRMVHGKDRSPVHPIDDYLASLNGTKNYDMLAVSREGTRLLGLEIDRCVKEVLALKHLPAKERTNFIRLTKARLDYCEMQSAFGADAIYRGYYGGSAAGPLAMSYRMGLFRQALTDLLELSDDYVSFDEPLPELGR